jgi:cytidine deaminase
MWADELFTKAKARKTAVAARLVTSSGKVYYGVNIESSCHTLSICAERAAIVNAVIHEGPSMEIRSIEVQALKDGHRLDIIPCGGCRQLAAEFAAEDTEMCGKLLSKWLPNPYL